MVDRLVPHRRSPSPKRTVTVIFALVFSLLLSPFMGSVVPIGNPSVAHAFAIIHVNAAADSGGDGMSWATAYDTLQDGLNDPECASACEVWVAEGVYVPSQIIDPTATFSLTQNVEIYGGFVGDETSRDQRDWQAHETVLSGDLDGDETPTNNAYHVVTASYPADATAVLDGFTITGGYAGDLSPNNLGGGMYIDDASPILRHLVIEDNYAIEYGGGMYNTDGDPLLIDVTFYQNTAGGSGGGMYTNVGAPSIWNSAFLGNVSEGSALYQGGGGIYSNADNLSAVMVVNTIFAGNDSAYDGGGLYGLNSGLHLINVTVSGNDASNSGGGLAVGPSSNDVYAENSIFWGNTATTNANIQGQTDTNLYQNVVEGGVCPAGAACSGAIIGSDPLFFRNPDPGADATWGTDDDDYGDLHVRSESPALNAGDNDSLPEDALDLDNDSDSAEPLPIDRDGDERQVDHPNDSGFGVGTPPIVDLGTYETQIPGITIDPVSVDVEEDRVEDTYEVSLDSIPSDNVQITITTDGQTTVNTTTLTFTADDWYETQTVTVTAEDDLVAEGLHSSAISHVTSSTDTGYNGISSTVIANISDNDGAGLGISESGDRTEVVEGSGKADRYDVWLFTEPTGDVTVHPIFDDVQVALEPTELVFTTDNWYEPQTILILANDDQTDESDPHELLITHAISSSDSFYDGLSGMGPVNVIIHDPGDFGTPLALGTAADSEPNNGMNECQWFGPGFQGAALAATPDSWNASIEGALDAPDDIDWYKFEVTQPDSVVAITLTNLSADYDLVLGRFSPFPGVAGQDIDYSILDIVNLSSVKSSRAMSSRAMSSRAMSSRAMSSRAMSSRAMSSRAMSSRAMSSRAMSSRAMSSRAMSSRAMSSGRFSEIMAQVSDIGGTVTAVSMELGKQDEVIETGLWFPGVYYIAIVNNNGDYSEDPYLLQFELEGSGIDPVASSLPITYVTTPDERVQTLFIVNAERMKQLYPDETITVDQIVLQLQTIASRSDVNGRILRMDSGGGAADVAALYDDWDSDPANPFLANRLAETIDNRITSATLYNPSNLMPDDPGYIGPPFPNVEYIVLVGGDGVIPFYRLPDMTVLSNEGDYYDYMAGLIDDSSALAGALFFGTTLSDNIYGSDEPYNWPTFPLYIPNRAVGRLVEKPSEIQAYLEQYIFGSDTAFVIDASSAENRATVTGYDFLADQGDAINDQLTSLGVTVDTLIDYPPDEVWTSEDLEALIFDSQYGDFAASNYILHSPIPFQSINAHFDHYRAIPAAANSNPDELSFYAKSILEPSAASGLFSLYFQNRLAYSIGCHSGLNVEDHTMLSDIQPIYLADFPQAFMKQGGNFIGNTGFGYGDTEKIAYGEDLLLKYTEELGRNVTDTDDTYIGQSIGMALVQARQRYLASLPTLDTLDVKTMQQATLYGLPFIRTKVAAPIDIVDEPVQRTEQTWSNSFGITERTITFTIEDQASGSEQPDPVITSVEDSFEANPDIPTIQPDVREGLPEMPLFSYDLSAKNQSDERMILKHVVLADAQYETISDYEPRITWVVTRSQVSETPTFPTGVGVWYPDIFYNASSTTRDEALQDRLLVIPAQYQGVNEDGTQGTLRLYTRVTFTVIYIDPDAPDAFRASLDTSPPIIKRVDVVDTGGTLQAADTRIVVEVEDAPESSTGIPSDGVQAAYAAGDENWQHTTFTQPFSDTLPGIWVANLDGVAASDVRYIVTVIDNAGNVAHYNNKGNANLAVLLPIDAIAVNGPSEGMINTTYAFSTTLAPLSATRPVSYTWSPEPSSGQDTHKVTYNFATVGRRTITLTVIDPSTGSIITSEPFVLKIMNEQGISEAVYLPVILR